MKIIHPFLALLALASLTFAGSPPKRVSNRASGDQSVPEPTPAEIVQKRIAAAIGGNVGDTDADHFTVGNRIFKLWPVQFDYPEGETKFSSQITQYVSGEPVETWTFALSNPPGQHAQFDSELEDESVTTLLKKSGDEIQRWFRDGGKFSDGSPQGDARDLMARTAAELLHASTRPFTRKTLFESVDAFVTTARLFQPAGSKSDLARMFRSRALFKDEHDPATTANTTDFSAELWSSDLHALVFVRAKPPTEGMPSAVGVLFLLTHRRNGWRVADLRRFDATGKYAGVTAECTSGSDFNNHSDRAVVTITESQGGRGVSWGVSASYTIASGKLKKMDLE